MPTLTVEIPDELHAQFQKLAADMEQSVEQCQIWALEDFVAQERPATDDSLEGLRDIEAGRVVPHEEVVAWLASLGTEHPLPRPVSHPVQERLAS